MQLLPRFASNRTLTIIEKTCHDGSTKEWARISVGSEHCHENPISFIGGSYRRIETQLPSGLYRSAIESRSPQTVSRVNDVNWTIVSTVSTI